jgi:hypothetical protein
MAKFITNWSIGVLANAIWAVAGFFIGRALQMQGKDAIDAAALGAVFGRVEDALRVNLQFF